MQKDLKDCFLHGLLQRVVSTLKYVENPFVSIVVRGARLADIVGKNKTASG